MTLAMHRVLVIEDDAVLQSVLRALLQAQGFRVVLADSYASGADYARSYHPDLIIADLGLTVPCGFDFIRKLRGWSATPIIALSAHATEAQRITAYDSGADDYVEVPFSDLALVARTRAILRRHARGDRPQPLLNLGAVCVDLERRLARHRDGRKVRLTPIEHRMLETFARHPDRMITHEQLMREVWGPHMENVGAVRVYIASLRRKVEEDPRLPRHIITEFGTGYRLIPEAITGGVAAPNGMNYRSL
jgi:two-component system, OmpR family, KDP operon response regulator KdpE